MDSYGSRCGLFFYTVFFMIAVCSAQLSTRYYDKYCPKLERIVSDKIDEILSADWGMAAGILRLHFHDCFVRGCDASVLLDSTIYNQAEKDAPPNKGSLRGFAEIEAIKATVESHCPGVVSCADILALAARDVTAKVGGQWWPVSFGRRDGRLSYLSEANASLPSPFMNYTQLVENFAAVGLDAKDMVVLSGAHTIGQAHCAVALPRINFNNVTGATDPSLDAGFAKFLRTICPADQPLNFIATDPTNGTFDNAYYIAVLSNKGILSSDATLVSDSFGLHTVIEAVRNADCWMMDFAVAMVKMGNIDVLTGSEGEIRDTCSSVNAYYV